MARPRTTPPPTQQTVVDPRRPPTVVVDPRRPPPPPKTTRGIVRTPVQYPIKVTRPKGLKDEAHPYRLKTRYKESGSPLGRFVGTKWVAPSGYDLVKPEEWTNYVGYKPEYWEHPLRVARYHNLIQSLPPGASPPDWLDVDRVEMAYEYFKYANGDTPWQEWKYLAADDPMRDYIRTMTNPPVEAMWPGEVTSLGQPQEPGALDQGIDFSSWTEEDWAKLPAWHRWMYSMTSNPYTQSTMTMLPWSLLGAAGGAMAGGTTGAFLGAGVGAVPGAILGGIAGFFAPQLAGWALGFVADPNTYQKMLDSGVDPKVAKDLNWLAVSTLGLLNLPAEYLEQTLGVSTQISGQILAHAGAGDYAEEKPLLEYLPEVWKSSRLTYEVTAPAFPAIQNIPAGIEWLLDMARTGESDVRFADKGYVHVLGEAEPKYVGADALAMLVDARRRMINGESPAQVVTDYQQTLDIGGQMTDLIYQMGADPLNVVPTVERAGVYAYARMTDNVPLQMAAILAKNEGLIGTKRVYGQLLRSGYGPEVAQMSSRMLKIAGLTPEGIIKELKPGRPTPKGVVSTFLENPFNPTAWFGSMAELTPSSRARVLLGLAYEVAGELLNSESGDPIRQIELVRQWIDTSPRDASRVAKILGFPEAQTVRQALTEITSVLNDMEASWTMGEGHRSVLVNVSNALGETPGKTLEMLREGKADEVHARFVELLQGRNTEGARAILADPSFTPQNLARITEYFETNPWHPDHFQANLTNTLLKATMDWSVKAYGVKPDTKFIRFFNGMKSIQSLLLLGFNPAYYVNNAVNNVVTRAASGVFGFVTSKEIGRFFEEWGLEPYRLRAGIGAADIGIDNTARSVPTTGEAFEQGGKIAAEKVAMAEAENILRKESRGGDWVQNFQDIAGRSGEIGPFTRLSRANERKESASAMYLGVRQFFDTVWSRNMGIPTIPPELKTELAGIDPRLPDALTTMIEKSKRPVDLDQLFGTLKVKKLIDPYIPGVAESLGIRPEEVREVLSLTGTWDAVQDQLDAGVPIADAFANADRQVRRYIDERLRHDLITRATEAQSSVQAEGFVKALDIFKDMQLHLEELWTRHFAEWQRAYELAYTDGVSYETRRAIVRDRAETAKREWIAHQRWEESTWLGVLKGLGFLDPTDPLRLSTDAQAFAKDIIDLHHSWADFFERRGRMVDKFFDTKFDSKDARNQAWAELQQQISDLYLKYTDKENKFHASMAERFIKLFSMQFGPDRVAGAAEWWKAVGDLSVKRQAIMADFRKFMNGGPVSEILTPEIATFAATNGRDRLSTWPKFLRTVYLPIIGETVKAGLDGAWNMYRDVTGATPAEERVSPDAVRDYDTALRDIRGRDMEEPPAPEGPPPEEPPPGSPAPPAAPVAPAAPAAPRQEYPAAYKVGDLVRLGSGKKATVYEVDTFANPPTYRIRIDTTGNPMVVSEGELSPVKSYRTPYDQANIDLATEFGVERPHPKHLVRIYNQYQRVSGGEQLDPNLGGGINLQKIHPDDFRLALEHRARMQQFEADRNATLFGPRDKIGENYPEYPETFVNILSEEIAAYAKELLDVLPPGDQAINLVPNPDDPTGIQMLRKSNNPEWYQELYARTKVSKDSVISALERIIADEGKDRIANGENTIELVKDIVFARMRQEEQSAIHLYDEPWIPKLLAKGDLDTAVDVFEKWFNSYYWDDFTDADKWAIVGSQEAYDDLNLRYIERLEEESRIAAEVTPGTDGFDNLPGDVKQAIENVRSIDLVESQLRTWENSLNELTNELLLLPEPDERRQLVDLREEIERLKAENEQLKRDPLTQIPVYIVGENRAKVDSAPAKLAVDVSGLKYLNDNFGEESGNSLLVAFARAATEAGYDPYRVVMGGDEFVLPFSSPGQAEAAAQHLKQLFSQAIIVAEDKDGNVTYYRGFTIYTGVGDTYRTAYDGVNAAKQAYKEQYPGAQRGEIPPTVARVEPIYGEPGSSGAPAEPPTVRGIQPEATASESWNGEAAPPGAGRSSGDDLVDINIFDLSAFNYDSISGEWQQVDANVWVWPIESGIGIDATIKKTVRNDSGEETVETTERHYDTLEDFEADTGLELQQHLSEQQREQYEPVDVEYVDLDAEPGEPPPLLTAGEQPEPQPPPQVSGQLEMIPGEFTLQRQEGEVSEFRPETAPGTTPLMPGLEGAYSDVQKPKSPEPVKGYEGAGPMFERPISPDEPAPAHETPPAQPQAAYKVGDRVVTKTGLHGEVIEVESYRMQDIFGGSVDVRHVYRVKTDNGRLDFAPDGDWLTPEVERPKTVVLDPIVEGEAMAPDSLYSSLLAAKRGVREAKDKYRRARTDKGRRAARVDEQYQQGRVDYLSRFWDDWKAIYPKEANDIIAKRMGAAGRDVVFENVPATTVKPAEGGPDEIRLNDERQGIEIVFQDRPEQDVIDWLRNNGFRWSSRQKLWYAKDTPDLRQAIDGREWASPWAKAEQLTDAPAPPPETPATIADIPAKTAPGEQRWYLLSNANDRYDALIDLFGYTPEQAANEMMLLDAVVDTWSKRFGHTGDVYHKFWQQLGAMRGSETRQGKKQPQEWLSPGRRGAYSVGDSRTLIHALENADVDTFVHEGSHYFFDWALSRQDQAIVMRVAGVETTDPTRMTDEDYRAVQEFFAEGYVRYRTEGKAPSTKLRVVFESFKAFIRSVLERLKSKFDWPDIFQSAKLDPEMESVYRRLFALDPWEMTADEYAALPINDPSMGGVVEMFPSWNSFGHNDKLAHHKDIVYEAYRRGKKIPARVMTQYQDLVKDVSTEMQRGKPVPLDHAAIAGDTPPVLKTYDNWESGGKKYQITKVEQYSSGELMVTSTDLTVGGMISRVDTAETIERLTGYKVERPIVDNWPEMRKATHKRIDDIKPGYKGDEEAYQGITERYLDGMVERSRPENKRDMMTLKDAVRDAQLRVRSGVDAIGRKISDGEIVRLKGHMKGYIDKMIDLMYSPTEYSGQKKSTGFSAEIDRRVEELQRQRQEERGGILTPEETVSTTPPPAPVQDRNRTFMDGLYDDLVANAIPQSTQEFEAYARQRGFELKEDSEISLVYDLLEGAYNRYAQEIWEEYSDYTFGNRVEAILGRLLQLEQTIAKARRTVTKLEDQQFSTPLPIAAAAQLLADIRPGDTVVEPTAGTANLVFSLIGSQDVRTIVNEIDPGRLEVLNLLGFEPTDVDLMGRDWVLDRSGNKLGALGSVVITNPPWGSYSTGKYGRAISEPVALNDWSQRFIYLTMQRLADGGRMVAVVPTNWVYVENRTTRAISLKESEFMKWLRRTYDVRAILESPNGAYDTRAAGVNALLVVIDKRTPFPIATMDDKVRRATIERYGERRPIDWREFVSLVAGVVNSEYRKREQGDVNDAQYAVKRDAGRGIATAERPRTGPDATGLVDPAALTGEPSDPARIGEPSQPKPATHPTPGAAGVGGAGGQERGIGAGGEQPGEAGDVGKPREPGGPTSPTLVARKPGSIRKELLGRIREYSEAFTQRLNASREAVKDSGSFALYVARSPLQPDDIVSTHPAAIVETKNLSGVPYPELEPEYRPTPSVMRAVADGRLSAEGNLDPIWAAIQQNDKYRSGILIADDVGIGKSRSAAGFVIDRIERGKKRILVVTQKEQNVDNLMLEFAGVYNGKVNEFGAFTEIDPADFPAKMVKVSDFKEVRKGNELLPKFDEPAVYFVHDLALASYMDAIKDVAPEVVVVDEVHSFKREDTDKAYAWSELHKDWLGRHVDMMYLSATPATDIAEMRYLYGLRLWTQDGFQDWVNLITGKESPEKIKARNAAMDQVVEWRNAIMAAREQIATSETTYTEESWRGKETFPAIKIGDRILYYNKRGKEWAIRRFENGEYRYESAGTIESETQGIIVADMMNKDPMLDTWQAVRKFKTDFPAPDRHMMSNAFGGYKEANELIRKLDNKKTWGKKGLSAYESTLPPAHTEQIMREMKVSGHYMSRDISRHGVEYEAVGYDPTPEQLSAYNKRADLFIDIIRAFNKYGKYNEGPKAPGGAYGVNGDVQQAAKRALFDLRLPGIVEQTRKAMDDGQKVVISLLSVSEVSQGGAVIRNAIDKINTHEVKNLGHGEYSDAEEIPEALLAVAELRERADEMPTLPSPIDYLRDVFGDKITFITGAESIAERKQAVIDFQSDRIPIVVISGAGKTGINLHDLTGKRVSLVVGDYEWSSTNFKQELGRVDRTGQASSPYVYLMHVGSAAEKKFLSTIMNRMKGLGAASKGASESTSVGGLQTEFEIGGTLDQYAIAESWRALSPSDREWFLDRYFDDPQIAGMKKSSLDTTAKTVHKWLMAFQSMPIEVGNRVYEQFEQARAALIDSDAAQQDVNKMTARNTGEVLRVAPLADNLIIAEVRDGNGDRSSIIYGVLTPYMNKLQSLITQREVVTDSWRRWISFYDEGSGEYIAGLKVTTSASKRVAEAFGQRLSGGFKPETALRDLKAGDKIPVRGVNMAEWQLYIGKAGEREGKIIIGGAKIRDRDAIMNHGAKYMAIGNFFYLPEENLQRFLQRFRIDESGDIDAVTTLYQTMPDGTIKPDPQAEAASQRAVPDDFSVMRFRTPFELGDTTVVGMVFRDGKFQAWIPTSFAAAREFATAEGRARVLGIDGAGNWVIARDNGEIFRQPMGDKAAEPLATGPLALGTTDATAGPQYDSQIMGDGHVNVVRPILDQLRKAMLTDLRPIDGDYSKQLSQLSQPGKRNLQRYLSDTKEELSKTRLAAMRFGEQKRDLALLNYSRRYGFDNAVTWMFPYQFWYTRSMFNWAMRVMDRPAFLSQYARIMNFMSSRKQEGYPGRLRKKMRFSAPWLPDWAGGGVFVDPMSKLFPFSEFMRPIERIAMDRSRAEQSAEYIITTWQRTGEIDKAEAAQALATHQGVVWDRAYTQAKVDGGSDALDYMSLFISPALYLQVPYRIAQGKPEQISPLPYSRTMKALSTATGLDVFDALDFESKLRKRAGLSEFGEWGDYFIERQLGYLVADGEITIDDAMSAMMEKQGEAYELARQRVAYEQALTVPGASTIMAGKELLKGNVGVPDMAAALLYGWLPQGLFPDGEMKIRGLKDEYDQARESYNAGNKDAMDDFFAKYPEYEARLALGDDPEDRLRQHLISSIWDGYSELPKLWKREIVAGLGPKFEDGFLSEDTRDYESIDTDTLAFWAQAFGQAVPEAEGIEPMGPQEEMQLRNAVSLSPESTAQIYEQYQKDKAELFPNANMLQTFYFNLPKAQRKGFLAKYPELKKYWDWSRQYKAQYPELQDAIDRVSQTYNNGSGISSPGIAAPAADNKRVYVDVTAFSQPLQRQLVAHFTAKRELSSGAMQELRYQWEKLGKPGGSFRVWLEDYVGSIYDRNAP